VPQINDAHTPALVYGSQVLPGWVHANLADVVFPQWLHGGGFFLHHDHERVGHGGHPQVEQ
jgi:hypothetical protein